MNALACTWQQFKERVAEYFRALPTLNKDEMENAEKCICLSYLNLEASEHEKYQAVILLDIVNRKSLMRLVELMR